jgi:hypothetical protein
MSRAMEELVFNLLKPKDVVMLNNNDKIHYEIKGKNARYIFVMYENGILYPMTKQEMFLVTDVVCSEESRAEFLSIKVLERLSR